MFTFSEMRGIIIGTRKLQRGDNVIKKEMIAMLLAGGQGSRLGVLTQKVAKPAVSFGGKYRIIDFPLSNCINSGVDTVGVLTQYQPLRLNSHIGIGIPWDLDRNVGGVTILPPYERSKGSDWYTGTANAIYQNLEYMESYNPDYVLILSGVFHPFFPCMGYAGISQSKQRRCHHRMYAGADRRGKPLRYRDHR